MKSVFSSSLIFIVSFLFIGCDKSDDFQHRNPPLADAGTSQIIQLPVNSATLSGSGTTENGKITGYLWSLVSGPNVPVITSESSATSEVEEIIAGTYVFQLMVIDSAGLTGIDTVSWLVKAPVQQTITLQPANNPNGGHVDSYYNQGGTGDTELPIGTWTISGTTFSWRSFLKFDFGQIPANATILDAKLYLYAMPNPHGGDLINAHSGPANAYYIERITTTNWTFNGMTWANQPASTAANRVLVPQSSSSFQDDVIDVKALVQDMVTNGNYGFKFRMQNEAIYNCRQYASSYHISATLHPKLMITYK